MQTLGIGGSQPLFYDFLTLFFGHKVIYDQFTTYNDLFGVYILVDLFNTESNSKNRLCKTPERGQFEPTKCEKR